MQTDKIQLVGRISGMGPIERFLSASIWYWKCTKRGVSTVLTSSIARNTSDRFQTKPSAWMNNSSKMMTKRLYGSQTASVHVEFEARRSNRCWSEMDAPKQIKVVHEWLLALELSNGNHFKKNPALIQDQSIWLCWTEAPRGITGLTICVLWPSNCRTVMFLHRKWNQESAMSVPQFRRDSRCTYNASYHYLYWCRKSVWRIESFQIQSQEELSSVERVSQDLLQSRASVRPGERIYSSTN